MCVGINGGRRRWAELNVPPETKGIRAAQGPQEEVPSRHHAMAQTGLECSGAHASTQLTHLMGAAI